MEGLNINYISHNQKLNKFQRFNLKANYIVFDWATSIVTAEGLPDSLGKMSGFPVFSDGDQSFEAKRMRYNFQTRKGVVYDVTTSQSDVVVKGDRSKFISGEETADTTKASDIIYSEDAIFTTCKHENPHFLYPQNLSYSNFFGSLFYTKSC